MAIDQEMRIGNRMIGAAIGYVVPVFLLVVQAVPQHLMDSLEPLDIPGLLMSFAIRPIAFVGAAVGAGAVIAAEWYGLGISNPRGAMGLLLAVLVTGANADDGTAAPRVIEHMEPERFPRMEVILGDNKYKNKALEAWMIAERPAWSTEVQKPPAGTKGFSPVRIRWVVERSNAWHGRCRRNNKDYERRTDSSEAMIKISHIGIMLRRLAPTQTPAFNYRTAKA